MPGAARADTTGDMNEVVDDAGRGEMPGNDRLVDLGGSAAAGPTLVEQCRPVCPPQLQGQQGPVHLVAGAGLPRIRCGVNRYPVVRVGQPLAELRVPVFGSCCRGIVELVSPLLGAQDVQGRRYGRRSRRPGLAGTTGRAGWRVRTARRRRVLAPPRHGRWCRTRDRCASRVRSARARTCVATSAS